jgi:hypothetical protein
MYENTETFDNKPVEVLFCDDSHIKISIHMKMTKVGDNQMIIRVLFGFYLFSSFFEES